VRRLFRRRQRIEDGPAAARDDEPAGDQVFMIRPNLDDIPQHPLPEGYRIRPMRLDEGGLWADIWRDAEPYYPMPNDIFHSEFDHDLQATQWRSFMIVTERDVAVGTVSAWYHRDHRGQDLGLIHWIAVRPAYQGLGLGKAAMSYALNRLAQWHDRAGLGTQTRRIAAIRLYLDFGFRPDLEPPGALESWRRVKAELDHPGLANVH
jgi:GNAT superfamily N-acetyltransferase